MGTPVPMRSRERECVGVDSKINTRQLTEEERRYYDSLRKPKKRIVAYNNPDTTLFSEDKESEEMLNKPSKEKLIEMCQQYPSKYRASYGISKELGVSHGTIDNWIKAYDIKDVWKKPEENMQEAEKQDCSGSPETDTKEFDVVVNEEVEHLDNISEGINSEQPAGEDTSVEVERLEEPQQLIVETQPCEEKTIYPDPDSNRKGEPVSTKPERRHLVTQVLCMDRVINISRVNKEIKIKNYESTELMTIKFEEFPDFLRDLYEIFKSYV